MKKRELRHKDIYSEKEKYKFTLKKELFFENEEYYVLESEFGKNHLIAKKYYGNYNFKIGEKINCYVDKINCAGQIFLEPEHPFYKLNERYRFKIKTSGTKMIKEIVDFGLFLENIYGEEIFFRTSRENAELFLQKNEIELKLIRIKKGIFVLIE